MCNISSINATVNFQKSQVFCYTNVNKSIDSLNFIRDSVPKLNIFQRREQIELVANKLLRGAKSTVSLKVFHFFLSKADNETGISRHSIEAISNYTSYCKQWVQEGINHCVKVGLITRIRRGIKKTNIYLINYELIGNHSYKTYKLSDAKKEPTELIPLIDEQPCKQPKSTEAVSVASQSSLSNNSNCSNIYLDNKKEEDIKNDDQNQSEIINPDTFYPSGTALEHLCNVGRFINKEFYLKELRNRLKIEEEFAGRPLTRREANYKTFPILNATQDLWRQHNERYIPVSIRQKHKKKINEPNEINQSIIKRSYNMKPNIPEGCFPIENPATADEMDEAYEDFYKKYGHYPYPRDNNEIN